MLVWLLVLVVSLFLLVKSADYFNNAAEKVGLSFGFSPFIIGVVIVAVGTSLPELVSSVLAVIRNSSEIVVGNVLGSNVSNVFFILGLTAVVYKKPIRLRSKHVLVDLQFLVGSSLFLAVTIYDRVFNVWEGILCVAAFVVYILYQVRNDNPPEEAEENGQSAARVKVGFKEYAILVISAAFIYASAEAVIASVTRLSEFLGLGKEIIAASMIALGTSLPELSVSLNAASKGNTDVAVGNILGSSIFNSFWVTGFASFFGEIAVPENMLTISLPFMLIATFLLFILTRDKELRKWEGYLFLLFYVLFLGKLFALF